MEKTHKTNIFLENLKKNYILELKNKILEFQKERKRIIRKNTLQFALDFGYITKTEYKKIIRELKK